MIIPYDHTALAHPASKCLLVFRLCPTLPLSQYRGCYLGTCDTAASLIQCLDGRTEDLIAETRYNPHGKKTACRNQSCEKPVSVHLECGFRRWISGDAAVSALFLGQECGFRGLIWQEGRT
eukprot:1471011-Rhodomonas_salina.1